MGNHPSVPSSSPDAILEPQVLALLKAPVGSLDSLNTMNNNCNDGKEDHHRSAHRRFYTMPQKPEINPLESIVHAPVHDHHLSGCFPNQSFDYAENNASDPLHLIGYINENIIGRNKIFRGPFGDRQTIYCDWTASAKSLFFIEDFISSEVLPNYGNTHTTTNVTSLQTTMFRHEARDIIRNAVRGSDEDAVIFVGSGCTGAIHKLIHNLHLEQPPIVIVGPFEHHSNILPWRHLAHKVCRASTDSSGTVSLESLESLLRVESVVAQELGCKLIVCMAAASNVTGILVDVNAFSSLTHRYGGLAFWDYATAAPYVKIDMNPVVTGPDHDYVYKDAVYFSMHKFIGGPQTPGVLVAKRSLFKAGEVQPSGCGGGTVFFVRRDGQVYLKEVEEREEGGTPAIVESIRAGLVMQLKEAVTCEAIMEREEQHVRRIWDRLADCRNIIVLGGKEAPRLPIISVVVRHSYPIPSTDNSRASCLFLHHNFVASLLNDLFGVQARGGCACAGPYAMDLLGIDEALAKLYEETLVGCRLETHKRDGMLDSSQHEVIRPGFTRVSLPFFTPDAEADFILDAIKFVATHGWAFLPLYSYNPSTAEWVHRQHDPSRDRKWLGNVNYTDGKMTWSSTRLRTEMPAPQDFEACMKAAYEELCRAVKTIDFSAASPVPDDTACFDEPTRELRWFLLPSEAAAQIRNEINQLAVSNPNPSPWHPGSLVSCFCPDLQNPPDELNPTLALTKRSPGQSDLPNGLPNEYSSDIPASIQHIEPPSEATRVSPVRYRVKEITIDQVAIIPHRKGKRPRARSANDVRALETQDELRSVQVRSPDIPHDSLVDGISSPTQFSLTDQVASGMGKSVTEKLYMRPLSDQYEECQSMLDANMCAGMTNNHHAASVPTATDQSTVSETDLKSFSSCQATSPKQLSPSTSPTQSNSESATHPSSLWRTPPKPLFKAVLRAIRQFDMIHPGDRVLVCLSGGKDSMSLLHTLHQYQTMLQHGSSEITSESFHLAAVTVDPGTSAYDPRPLIPYLTELGVDYYYEKQGIIRQATDLPYEVASICSFCSRMKRGRIYACARRHGYNVIALGQHLDDVAESFLMSCFHNGLLLTMKANYCIRQGDLRVIRPLVFVREQQCRTFVEKAKLSIIPENCPACFSAPKERLRIKRILAEQEVIFPRLFPNLLSTMMPLIGEGTTRPEKKRTRNQARAVLNGKLHDQCDTSVNTCLLNHQLCDELESEKKIQYNQIQNIVIRSSGKAF
ncbi:tRNA 2-thiocytidine biosynthesis protein TtcA [Fasciola hepatica]|uniref:tRNA 2-thiocytidine biosynthesis protein TtcA n=1 Tax=Fasciola hepatica TaxID=6192 RepID=A0A4E0RJU7_FASHE|nr:tRNA 2-thiocytidine biosynthesis protein TtcA [Fasciola hepatica]